MKKSEVFQKVVQSAEFKVALIEFMGPLAMFALKLSWPFVVRHVRKKYQSQLNDETFIRNSY